MATQVDPLALTRYYTQADVHPYDTVEWTRRDVVIRDKNGETVFAQAGVDVPVTWSETATTVVANKYFRLMPATTPYRAHPGVYREQSVREMLDRVVHVITEWGVWDGYFTTDDAADVFAAELTYLLLHQYACFNSPVWFNLGVVERPQVSACFILDVDDTMSSIMQWMTDEARIFQGGSGAGANLSKLRGSGEPLSRGGVASGPLPFAKAADYSAGAIKSGGVVRRAAKMLQLDIDHPDILDFIQVKTHEERKAHALIAAGYSNGLEGEAYETVAFQNQNMSVVTPDAFWYAVEQDGEWQTRYRMSGAVAQTYQAQALCDVMAQATWACGDPGVFFADTVNAWNTTPSHGAIRGSNPCQPAHATVLTPEGIRTFADIDVGSIIWSGKRWTHVTRKIATGIQPVFIYHTDGGSFVGTKEHKILSNGQRIAVQYAETIDGACLPEDGRENDAGNGNVRVKTSFDVHDVDALGEMPVYDITVDDVDHTYWTDGLLVSNCSEFLRPPNSACNLASINLLKFLRPDGTLDVDGYRHATRVLITAQEILVSRASYPTDAIARNTEDYRELGLGYANLGALLMACGLPYASSAGRTLAAGVTALLTGEAYAQSARLAALKGAFNGFAVDRGAMLGVIAKHADAVKQIAWQGNRNTWEDMRAAVEDAWIQAMVLGEEHGYRNAQVTLLAPCGTISFMMGCDTTGVEPILALVTEKALVGGGSIFHVNRTVPTALQALGYSAEVIREIAAYLAQHGTFKGAPYVQSTHLPVFAGALGDMAIPWQAHIDMMAAVQPFLSGGISKCVTGDTIIVTSKGLMSIGSLYGGEDPDTFRSFEPYHLHTYEVDSFDVPKVQGTTPAASFYYGGRKPVWRVTLSDGRTITGTLTHRLLCAFEHGLNWRRIVMLKPGDFVALQRGTEMWGSDRLPIVPISSLYGMQHKSFVAPTEGGRQLGTFIGMLTADGHITKSNYVVGLTKNEPEVLERFQHLLLSLFGLTGHKCTDHRNGVTSVQVGAKSLQEWLRAMDFSKYHIPAFIMRGGREMALGYLSGLYLDGWITQCDQVCISQKSRTLLNDVQALWDNLGIPTYFTHNIVHGKDYPVLHIAGGFRQKAAHMLEWFEPHKRERVAAIRGGRDERVFPLHREELLTRLRDCHLTQRFRSCFNHRTRLLRRSTFFAAAQACGMEVALDERVYDYLEVVSVDYVGEEEVYDLTIPETEAFIGNGIVNHNTVNMPADATVEDIQQAYLYAWRAGVKSLALFRDGCKAIQPVTVVGREAPAQKHGEEAWQTLSETDVRDLLGWMQRHRGAVLQQWLQHEAHVTDAVTGLVRDMTPDHHLTQDVGPHRKRLPDECPAVRQKFMINDHEGYIHVGLYPDTMQPGEIFVTMAKEGSTVSGLMDAFATAISLLLQYGAPLQALCDKFTQMRFEPAGFTNDANVPIAQSIMDYLFRWLAHKFLLLETEQHMKDAAVTDTVPVIFTQNGLTPHVALTSSEAPACPLCGNLMTRRMRACFVCEACGTTSGCS